MPVEGFTEYVFAPAASEALPAVELHARRRQADRRDVFCSVQAPVQNQESDVVKQVVLGKVLMDDDLGDVALLVRPSLLRGLGVPFAGSDFDVVRFVPA